MKNPKGHKALFHCLNFYKFVPKKSFHCDLNNQDGVSNYTPILNYSEKTREREKNHHFAKKYTTLLQVASKFSENSAAFGNKNCTGCVYLHPWSAGIWIFWSWEKNFVGTVIPPLAIRHPPTHQIVHFHSKALYNTPLYRHRFVSIEDCLNASA